MSAGGEKSASLKRAKSSRINNFGKRNSEPMADYDDEFAEAHAEFLRESMARRNSDVDVGEGRRFMEYQESAVEKVAQTEIRKAIAGPQTQQLDDVVVAVLDGGFTLKRLMRHHGRLRLEAANPSYPPLDLQSCDDVQIWGVAIHVIHPL